MTRQGDFSDSIWLIVEGKFEFFIDGKSQRALGKGSVFGEIGVIWNARRTTSVAAASKAVVIQIPADDLRFLMSQNLISEFFFKKSEKPGFRRRLRRPDGQ